MTPEAALIELLERVGARHGAAVVVGDHELSAWPGAAVAAMKSHGLITKARPASSAICPGCERECVMPVHILPHPTGPAAFIVCDKRSDINRVAVPISRLEQWQASGASIADLLAALLGLRRPGAGDGDDERWEIGMFKGATHSSHLVLLAGGRLTLSLAGHSIALADVLALEGNAFKVDKRTLIRLVDQPIAGAGDSESAAQRRERLKKRVQAVKAKGAKAFLKAVAEEEGISVSRLKQLLKEELEPTKARSRW
jgi:hypothetical protein